LKKKKKERRRRTLQELYPLPSHAAISRQREKRGKGKKGSPLDFEKRKKKEEPSFVLRKKKKREGQVPG